jgi:hypothetical protein
MQVQDSASEITNTTNQRIFYRGFPSNQLQPNINCRPVSTKYAFFPVVDLRKRPKIALKQYSVYNPAQTFNPSDCVAPWSGYSKNVNVESELRNQIYALQKSSRSVYVPNSSSDLYVYNQPYKPNPFQDQSLLFQKQTFDNFNPDNLNFNQAVFNNNTRIQLKNVNS